MVSCYRMSFASLYSNNHFVFSSQIISKKTKPFFGEKSCHKNDTNCEEETADEKYEGFGVDLIKEIFDNLRRNKFNYTYTFRNYEDKTDIQNHMKTRKSYGVLDELLNNVSMKFHLFKLNMCSYRCSLPHNFLSVVLILFGITSIYSCLQLHLFLSVSFSRFSSITQIKYNNYVSRM